MTPGRSPHEVELTEQDERREDEADQRVSGRRPVVARAAALEAVGGGTLTQVELADDGGSGHEVELKRPDGGSVEVRLDHGFGAVSTASDG